jgi:putative SOS response-associated peptidase YedK
MRDPIAATYGVPFKKRRCLIPTTGWYAWQKFDAKTKRPHHFQPNAQLFAFGGVYDRCKGDGREIVSFSIVTASGAAERRAAPRPHSAQVHPES